MPELMPQALLSAFCVSLLSFAGLFLLPLREERLRSITYLLVSLATGAMFGDAALHLLPDVFKFPERRLQGSLWVLSGILTSFVFEKFLRWKHEHGIHPHGGIKPVGRIIMVSDGLHNLVDGIMIGASYMVSLDVGMATTIAVALHELPHEIGDFGVLVDAGYSRTRALFFNFLSACTCLLGVFLPFSFRPSSFDFPWAALGVTAGSFIYIAGSNLTPELQKECAPLKSLGQLLAMILGIGTMFLLLAHE